MRLLILLIPFVCLGQKNPNQMFYSPRDKNLHFIAGVVIGVSFGELAYQLTDDCAITMSSAFLFPVTAGALKEKAYDPKHNGTTDLEDFVVTAMGGANAALGLRVSIDIRRKKESKKYKELNKTTI